MVLTRGEHPHLVAAGPGGLARPARVAQTGAVPPSTLTVAMREAGVLYVFGFERTGVAIGDLYFADPDPPPGEEGAERGVRLEVRLLVRGPLPGSAYSARPIELGRPVWRADLLESVDGPPGSFDRTHYHPQLQGWEPGRRAYDRDLSAHPVEWVGARLAGLETLLAEAGVAADPAYARDAEELRGCLAEIMDTVGRLLERVRRGELARPPGGPGGEPARVGWL
ncbi:MAG: hypothetical protein ACHQCE_05560 [Streptosporangiales bacterium]